MFDYRTLPVQGVNHKRQKRQTLHDMTRPLKEWLQAHTQNPYPSKSEKISLALNANMTLTQVSNWFANARRRLKNTAPEPDVTWAKRRGSHGNNAGSCSDESNMESDDERPLEGKYYLKYHYRQRVELNIARLNHVSE